MVIMRSNPFTAICPSLGNLRYGLGCWLLFGLVFAFSGPAASDSPLGPNPSKAYVAHLKSLYKTDDSRLALSRHINSLLKFYALGGKHPVFRIRVKGSDLLTYRHSEDSRETSDIFTVYGLNPYVQSECGKQAIYAPACWIKNPATGDPWLIIQPEKAGIEELRKATTALLIELQR